VLLLCYIGTSIFNCVDDYFYSRLISSSSRASKVNIGIVGSPLSPLILWGTIREYSGDASRFFGLKVARPEDADRIIISSGIYTCSSISILRMSSAISNTICSFSFSIEFIGEEF
jgi:hypothetical protein